MANETDEIAGKTKAEIRAEARKRRKRPAAKTAKTRRKSK